MEQLINDEKIVAAVNIGTEVFTVTDKRVLYNNSGMHNTFIGLRDLKGAEVIDSDMKFRRINFPPSELLSLYISVIALASVYVYYCTTDPKFAFGEFAPLLLAFFWLIGILPVSLIVLYSIQAMTSYTLKRSILNIVRTDNTYFCNQHYDPTESVHLQLIVKEINNAIFK